MRKLLEELYRGNINPMVKQFNRGTRYDESLRMMCKNEEKLNTMLEGKEKETFEKFKGCQDEVIQFNEEDAFVAGFRLGARLIIESLCENDGFFSEIDA